MLVAPRRPTGRAEPARCFLPGGAAEVSGVKGGRRPSHSDRAATLDAGEAAPKPARRHPLTRQPQHAACSGEGGSGLLRAAMQRDERRQVAAAEARAIKNDPVDLAEVRVIQQEMAALHAG